MRKTLGAVRGRLVGQFLGESILFSLLSLGLAVAAVVAALPAFRAMVGRDLSFNLLHPPWLILILLGAAFLVGILAGGYPAFILSAFHPARIFRGTLNSRTPRHDFRRVLVVVQFAISIALIISTLIVYRQVRFMKTVHLGFDKEHVVVIPGIDEPMRENYPSVRSQLLEVPGVLGVGASSYVPGRGHLVGGFEPEGFPEGRNLTMDYLEVDFDYLPTMGIELAAGRNFDAALKSDEDASLLINETAAEKIGWEDPVGQNFLSRPPPGQEGEVGKVKVVGVVKDFHLASLRNRIEPLIIFCQVSQLRVFSVRIAPGDVTATIKGLERKWAEIAPNRPFDYLFLDESFDSQYRAEERLQSVIFSFSVMAVFIGCLGLFGMASYAAERRTKEIGIRKVLGASEWNITVLTTRRFFLLVLIADAAAAPAAYFAMRAWLQNFAYRTGIGAWIFLLSGAASLVIALLTVGRQTIRAALADPVASLRYE